VSAESEQSQAGRQPTEEELRAAYEEQVKQLRIEHVLLEDVVTVINLGMRRTGLVEGTEAERDPDQVRLAIEAVRALVPLLEQAAPAQGKQIRDALSQLQMAFVKAGGSSPPPGGAPPGEGDGAGPRPEPRAGEPPQPGEPPAPGEPPKPGEPGPAQRSGRLWVPGR
jgi:hypothetical protein